jgi:hypothetical protein
VQQKTIQLRLRQWIGAGLLERVLRRHHHEQRRQRARHAAPRDLVFLHRFQQRGLHLGGGEDDFVEQRAFDEFELPLVVDIRADEVTRQQVGGELDAAEAAVDGGRTTFF